MVIGLSALDTEAACAEAANVLDVLDRPPAGLMVQVGSPDPDTVVAQLTTVAERTGQGIVVQDYPVMSGVSIATDDLVAAVRRVPAAVAVKSESAPSPPAVATLVRRAGPAGVRRARRHRACSTSSPSAPPAR